MKNLEEEDIDIWKLVEEITKEVEQFPDWKKRGWLIIKENGEIHNAS